MKRLLIAAALLVAPALLPGPAARAQDQVHYFDRKTQQNKTDKGTVVKETPASVTLNPGGGKPAIEIPAADIAEIDYHVKDDEKFARLDWTNPNNALRRARTAGKPADRRKDLEKALDGFRALEPKLGDDKRLVRHVQFSIAEALALQAETDPKQADAALEAVKKFKGEHGDGWQLVKATKLLVRLLEQKGDEA